MRAKIYKPEPKNAVIKGVSYELHQGNAIAIMKAMPCNSVDSIVTDPP